MEALASSTTQHLLELPEHQALPAYKALREQIPASRAIRAQSEQWGPKVIKAIKDSRERILVCKAPREIKVFKDSRVFKETKAIKVSVFKVHREQTLESKALKACRACKVAIRVLRVIWDLKGSRERTPVRKVPKERIPAFKVLKALVCKAPKALKETKEPQVPST